MDPITLGLIAVGALIMGSLFKGGADRKDAAPPDEKFDTAVEADKTTVAAVKASQDIIKAHTPKVDASLNKIADAINRSTPAAIAVGGGLAGIGGAATGGAIVGVAATAALGTLITGDAWGGTAAVIQLGMNPMGGIVLAQTGNIGRVLGREIDRALGGDGKTGTGIVYQSAGFFAGAIVGIAGLSILPVVGAMFALIVAVGSLISDGARLAYGQAGITADSLADARLFRNMIIPHLLRTTADMFFNGDISKIGTEDLARIRVIAGHMAYGWIQDMNRSRESIWRSRPHGFGQSNESHWQYGFDRGYFAGPVQMNDVKTLLLADGPTLNDVQADKFEAVGRFTANFSNYMTARKEPIGLGLDFRGHLQYWKDAGAFVCEEVYADALGDSIRVFDYDGNNIWLLGNDSEAHGKLETYPA